MSLIDEFKTNCKIIDRVTASDGEGGYTESWQDGATIKAAIVRDNSMQAKIAEKQGVTSTYTVTVDKTVSLPFHTVIKRLSDNVIFRITSDNADKISPASSKLNMAQYSAEKWELPR